ncbi:MAG: hypothetical protein EON95_18845 [Caulobacteraceae bacterium]|nr:MAG: hypothetical protein EON95_18845 [Caulobacteraceae bacterium]
MCEDTRAQLRTRVGVCLRRHRAGGIIVTPLPGATPTKPGSATFPFFGIKIELKDREGKLLEGNDVSGVVCVSTIWPSIARTIYGDHERYLATYMKPFPGCYFTGDGAIRDKDGYLWITGRVDIQKGAHPPGRHLADPGGGHQAGRGWTLHTTSGSAFPAALGGQGMRELVRAIYSA